VREQVKLFEGAEAVYREVRYALRVKGVYGEESIVKFYRRDPILQPDHLSFAVE
jgi:hypothetical protein